MFTRLGGRTDTETEEKGEAVTKQKEESAGTESAQMATLTTNNEARLTKRCSKHLLKCRERANPETPPGTRTRGRGQGPGPQARLGAAGGLLTPTGPDLPVPRLHGPGALGTGQAGQGRVSPKPNPT